MAFGYSLSKSKVKTKEFAVQGYSGLLVRLGGGGASKHLQRVGPEKHVAVGWSGSKARDLTGLSGEDVQ